MNRPSVFQSFTRSQIASFVATLFDFGLLVFCVEVLSFWYVLGTAIGAVAGAVTHFLFGRYWCFKARHGGISKQAVRYGFVSVGSLALNVIGVYILTDFLGIQYLGSKVATSLFVGFFFNYPLHRVYVFSYPRTNEQ